MAEITHPIPPVFDENCRVLILGSFPSVASREAAFFYGHKQNRFWKVLAAVFEEPVPETTEEKKALLLTHHIALWDVIARCEIEGSADSSIKSVIPNDIAELISQTRITRVLLNGRTAEKYYKKYLADKISLPYLCLPSTSPANAAAGMGKLTQAWSILKES